MNNLQFKVNVLALMQLVSQHTLWKMGFLLHKQSYQYDFHTIRYCVKSKRPYFSNNINTVCVAKWHSFTWVFPIYFELLMTYDTLLLMSVLSSHFDNFAIILGLHLQVSIRLYALFM